MRKKSSKIVVHALIGKIRNHATEAVIIAKASDQLARRGRTAEALKILMDVEGPIFEAMDLFRTAIKVGHELLSDTE
jgi:hypothetical protein